jgi:hypothetical protein
MIDPFITFVIHVDSLDDPLLLLTVDSVRQQIDICWELRIKVLALPDPESIETFTHDNPRITVTQKYFDKQERDFNSKVLAILPKGLELFPNACTELKKAFEVRRANIIIANTIFVSDLENDDLLGSTNTIPLIIATRLFASPNLPTFVEEIDLPVGVIRKDIFAASPVMRSEGSPLNKEQEIKAEHFAYLESEILILQAQLMNLTQKSDHFDVVTKNFNITKQQLAVTESELSAIKKSHTWRVGRFILSPIRLIKKLTD